MSAKKDDRELSPSRDRAATSSYPPIIETKTVMSSEKSSTDAGVAVASLIVVLLFVVAGSLVSVPGSSEPQVTGAAVGGLIGLALVILSWTWRQRG